MNDDDDSDPARSARAFETFLKRFEVGVSYTGRTYDEGKKIGWRDGGRALICVIKYSPVGRRLRRRPA